MIVLPSGTPGGSVGERTFACWVPERGETVADATRITSLFIFWAAEDYARGHADYSGDPFKELVVFVAAVRADGSVDRPRSYRVTVDLEPKFDAEEIETEDEENYV